MRRLILPLFLVLWAVPVAAQRPAIHTTIQTTSTAASSLLVGCALGVSTGCTGGINAGPVIVNTGGINIVSNVPADQTMKLVNNAGTLQWNGIVLGTGSSVSGTTGTIPKFTSSNAVGDSIITESGTTITVTGTFNATTAIQLNGTSINTGGTLSNVAYEDQANTFTNASGQTFSGGIGLSGGSPSTHGIMLPAAVPGILTTNLHNNAGLLIWTGGATFPGALTTNTVDTGQGANELYDMNQNVLTTSNPTFAALTVTSMNTYTFNQSVASGAGPSFTNAVLTTPNLGTPSAAVLTNATGLPAASVVAGTFSGSFTFGALTVSTLNTYTFDQSVASGASPTFVTVSANLTGNVTGNVSGSSGSTTGNAATATALQTARAINGTNFDGTAAITVTAAAGTLTGATLNSNVTASSLTSLGTITALVATTMNTYTFNQSVASGAGPTFVGTNFTSLPAAQLTGSIADARLSANVPLLNAANVFTANQTAPMVLTGASGWNVISAGDGVSGAYFATNTDFSNVSTVNQPAMRLLGDGTTPIQFQTSPATVGARTWTTRMSISSAGLLTVSGFGTHSFSAGGTGVNSLNVRNTTSGTGNYGEINVGSNTDAQVAVLRGYSSAFTTSGSAVASGAELRAPFAGGLSLSATDASGDIRLYSRSAIAVTVGAAQAVRMHAYGAGTATFDASGNITSVSDERQKDIQGAFTPGLNALMGLSPILYRYKASTGLDTENVYAGFSAQNVRDYIPEAIGKNLDGMYSLNIVPVLAATVTAVQELSREIDELRAAAELPSKSRTQAKADDTRVITSATPKRLAEKAKAESDRPEAEKTKAAQAARQAIRARLAACDAENDIIEAQGGTRQVCALTDAEKAERKALQTEAAAAKVKADADAAAQRKADLAACVALNTRIVAAGGKPRVCGMP